MDFINGLPKTEGNEVIFVVVDCFSKYAHFLALSHPYTNSLVVKSFKDNIYKLHGVPTTIISVKDPIFLNQFLKKIILSSRVDLQYSTAYHPRSSGQIEVANKYIENYLSCMTVHAPNQWVKWLPHA